MAWIILLVSAVLEAVWATALGASDGLTRPAPTVIFVVTVALSMVGLGWAARSIPMGTAYAVWTGTGAALTVGWAMAWGEEPVSLLRVLFLAGIIGCVIGIKLTAAKPPVPVAAAATTPEVSRRSR